VERKIISTSDGSSTVSIPEMNVTYHSVHGAIQESLHVFIDAGFKYVLPTKAKERINIFEMGLGTGLNALLTLIEADQLKQPVYYTAIELFPLDKKEIRELNYCEQLCKPGYKKLFEKLHQCEWDKDIIITPFFTLHKTNNDLIDFSTTQSFTIIYYDAFAPVAQPELWTKEVFEKLYSILSPGGILVTYCSKGDVRRAMQTAGFSTEKIPGPPGKREMLRARR
jgi:tRNA U34 5-methylaminomethyl-2-thiouridine-forming methyltransferase MnmC